nr:retrovirus-related Pol polyprotein from transposon TNT 1-94 [Tanacetum cinerariifolium]
LWDLMLKNSGDYLVDAGLLDCDTLYHMRLDRSFWAEALNTACYLINRSSATAINCKTLIEVWSGKPAGYSKLRLFGCPTYYHVSEGKLDPGGEKGIFIGYGDEVKGYRIWSPSGRRVILSRDLTFDEDYLFRVKQDPIESKLEDSVSEKVEDVPKQVEHVVPRDTDNDVTSPDDQPNLPHLDHEQDRSKEVESLEPATYREAITLKDYDMQIAAMGEAIESVHKNKTWELGYSQKEGIDYNEIFSLVVRHTSIRMLLSLVAHHDLELEQLDIKTAFLHVDLKEEIYMSQPEGFVVLGKEDYILEKDIEEVNKLKILLNTEFDMKDLGATRKILDQVYHDRTKHIDARYQFIRSEKRIKVKKIIIKDNHADVFTKPVPLGKFRHCLDLLNIDNWKYGVT